MCFFMQLKTVNEDACAGDLLDPTGFELQVGVEEINVVCCVKFVMRKKIMPRYSLII